MSAKNAANSPFVITRVFDAPRDLVFQVWTDPKHIAKWFAPKGFVTKFKTADIRVGGTSHYSMSPASGGPAMWGKATYQEIIKPSKIVYLQSFSDENGGITTHPMSPTWPLKMLTTITFEDVSGGKTKLTVTWTTVDANVVEEETFQAAKPGMSQGWGGTFEQLDAYLNEVKNA